MKNLFTLLGGMLVALSLQAQNVDTLMYNEDMLQDSHPYHQDLSETYGKKFLPDSEISEKDLNNRYDGDATRVLQNQTTGLSISANSYAPGASTRMILRGYRSFLGDNQPLILLNGLPYDNSEWNYRSGGTDKSNRLLDLDPSTIASIEVVNSIAGRARYGILGGNGVVNIKTKQRFTVKPSISFSSTIGMDKISLVPELQNTYAQGRSIGDVPKYRGPENYETHSWGPAISTLYFDGDTSYPYDKNGKLTTTRGRNEPAVSYDPYDFFQTGLFTNQSLNVNGGFKDIAYSIGGSYMNQQGVIPTTEYNRYNFSSFAQYNPNENLTVQLHAHITHSNSKRNVKGSSLSGIMLGLLRTPPTFDNTNGSSDPLNDPSAYEFSDGTPRSYSVFSNPYWSLVKNKHGDKVNRQHIGLAGTYRFTEKLAFSLRSSMDNYIDFRIGGYDINLDPFSQGIHKTGAAYERSKNYNARYVEGFLDYSFINNGPVDISMSYGFNYLQRLTRYDVLEGRELRSPNNVSVDNAKTVSQVIGEIDDRILGGVAMLDLTYANFLDFTASIRQDYSNKFGKETNGFLSYGLGLSASISDMLSIETNDLDINLHGSYGKFGNQLAVGQKIAKYQSKKVRLDNWLWRDVQLDGYSINPIIRSDRITAESIHAIDAGIDVAIGKRFHAGILYYHEASRGLLMADPLASSTGSTAVEKNVGSMTNRGLEASLTGHLIQMDKFSWTLALDFNRNKNKVNNIGKANIYKWYKYFTNSSVILEDQAYGVFYGPDVVRNDKGLVVVNEHGFPKRKEGNYVKGDPNPDWTMNIRNSLNIGKNLSIHGVVDIKQGGDMYCGTCASLDRYGRTQETANSRSQPFVIEGVMEDGTPNTIPVNPARYYGGYRYERGIYDASWIRLRNIGLRYDLTSLLQSSFIKGLSLSLYGENLFISTKYPGIDPETNVAGNSGAIGMDYFNNPGTKRYGIQLKATF